MKVKDLKRGMTVYECELAMTAELEVLFDAYRDVSLRESKDGYSCLVRGPQGHDFTLFQDKEITCYGPRLYLQPQYV